MKGRIDMKNKSLSNKTVKVSSIGRILGGTFLMAVVAGVFWHRRDIKRLIELHRM